MVPHCAQNLPNCWQRRSDTLIMLSATPHDGKARSFASLMNMLDPTAIANPDDYRPEDIKGLYIRRFKKDIQDQVESAFKERQISVARCNASPTEEDAFDTFSSIKFTQIDKKRSAVQLFKITIEKSLFSSPAACLDTINNRIRRLEKTEKAKFDPDIETLKGLHDGVEKITPDKFSKYKKLLDVIKNKDQGFVWTGKDKTDRLVIFTERIETLGFLHANLLRDLELNEDQISVLHGAMSDVDQQRIVEDFGRGKRRSGYCSLQMLRQRVLTFIIFHTE